MNTNLKRLREKAKLTQADVAKGVGKAPSLVAMWESGSRQPRADMLPKLARVLGCTIDDLFSAPDDETKAG